MQATTIEPTAPSGAGDVPLKLKLRRAERRKKLRYGALILPLAAFVLFTFVWPIASLMTRAVDNPEVVAGLPDTVEALRGWDGTGVPDDAAFDALARDLAAGKASREMAAVAKRLNMEEPGFRSLLMKSVRAMPPEDGVSARDALVEVDARWGETATWQRIARNAAPYTPYYLLAAIDHRIGEDGSIEQLGEDEAIFVAVMTRTFWMSLLVTAWCLALGFPLAYLLATLKTRVSNTLMIFVLLPFWTSVLVRVAAWIVLLQNEGLVNESLRLLGLIDSPLQLLFNRVGVYVAMVHILLPFMILPLYSVMKGISPTYMRAAVSLGCPPMKSFWRIYFPQTLPGVGAGSLLVFIMAMGYYITPALLGSPKEQMASYFVAFYTNQTINWGMAAALSAILLAATLVLYAVYSRYFAVTAKARR